MVFVAIIHAQEGNYVCRVDEFSLFSNVFSIMKRRFGMFDEGNLTFYSKRR